MTTRIVNLDDKLPTPEPDLAKELLDEFSDIYFESARNLRTQKAQAAADAESRIGGKLRAAANQPNPEEYLFEEVKTLAYQMAEIKDVIYELGSERKRIRKPKPSPKEKK